MTGKMVGAGATFVVAEITFTRVVEHDFAFASCADDKLHQLFKLFVGEQHVGLCIGASHGYDGEATPFLYARFNEQTFCLLQMTEIAFVDAGYNVPRQPWVALQAGNGL